jgi:hypothetical protein
MYLVINYDKGEFYLGPPAWRKQGAQELVPIVSSWYPRGGKAQKAQKGKLKSKVGAIAGGVVGGIAAVLIIGALVVWWPRKSADKGVVE